MTTWMPDKWAAAVQEADRRISRGWYAALCAAVFHAFTGGLAATGDGIWGGRLLYPLVLVVLAFAVARRSRIAAVLLVGQAVWVYGATMLVNRSAFWFFLLVGFGYCYVSGAIGTFRYHVLQDERPSLDLAPRSASVPSDA